MVVVVHGVQDLLTIFEFELTRVHIILYFTLTSTCLFQYHAESTHLLFRRSLVVRARQRNNIIKFSTLRIASCDALSTIETIDSESLTIPTRPSTAAAPLSKKRYAS